MLKKKSLLKRGFAVCFLAKAILCFSQTDEKKLAALACPWTPDSSHYEISYYKPAYDNCIKRLEEGLAKKSGCDLIFLGDTFVEGLELYPEILKKYFSSNIPLNLSVSGDLTQNVLYRLENPDMEKLKPKFVVLMVGAFNNLAKPDDTAKGITTIFEKIKKLWPESSIIFVSIPPVSGGYEKVNEKIQKEANGKNIFYLDLVQAMNDAGGFNKLSPDGMRFKEEGYNLFADNLSKKLAQAKSQSMFKKINKSPAKPAPAKNQPKNKTKK